MFEESGQSAGLFLDTVLAAYELIIKELHLGKYANDGEIIPEIQCWSGF